MKKICFMLLLCCTFYCDATNDVYVEFSPRQTEQLTQLLKEYNISNLNTTIVAIKENKMSKASDLLTPSIKSSLSKVLRFIKLIDSEDAQLRKIDIAVLEECFIRASNSVELFGETCKQLVTRDLSTDMVSEWNKMQKMIHVAQ